MPDMQWIQSDELLKQAMKNINQVIKNSFKETGAAPLVGVVDC